MDVANAFYQSAWFMLPVKQQLTFAMVIGRSQKEFHLKGLGFIECSLEVYWKVCCSCREVEANLFIWMNNLLSHR